MKIYRPRAVLSPASWTSAAAAAAVILNCCRIRVLLFNCELYCSKSLYYSRREREEIKFYFLSMLCTYLSETWVSPYETHRPGKARSP